MHKPGLWRLTEFELEREPPKAHFKVTATQRQVAEMLYQEKVLGRVSVSTRFAARLAILFSRRRYADLDLLALNPHLQRDLGIEALPDRLRPRCQPWK